ncbi:MAG: hypothetical protein IJX77_01620 [Ruminococcus sp.]|nr:hypothetical protein [Ruminococcus sp.]
MYIAGLFIMTIGIAASVKSNLGTAPVSSVPYTLTCVWGIEMGKATIMFHVSLVLVQVLILRKSFKIKNLLQIVTAVVFGYFTTFCNYCASFLPNTDNIFIRLILILISIVLIAFGLFLYVPADIMPVAADGTMKTISEITKIEFSKVKIAFDVTLVSISLIVCLVALRSTGSVGAGTIISAFLVGSVHALFVKLLGNKRDKLLHKV